MVFGIKWQKIGLIRNIFPLNFCILYLRNKNKDKPTILTKILEMLVFEY